jgi:hypothetical protein
MNAYQVYEQAIKPLSSDEKLGIVRLIMDEVVPVPMPADAPVPAGDEEQGFEYLKRILPQIERITLTQQDLDSVILKD